MPATSSLPSFAFGKNWRRFLATQFTAERVATAQRHLLQFLKLADLRGKVFLDVGSGSGIHSLAAYQAGADQVISFDVDADSVAATQQLWRQAGKPDHWLVLQGSVLDTEFIDELPSADIVYSWGVLHHTGAMWEAVAAAARLLKDDGVFYIALYCSDVYVDPPHEHWLKVKQCYNQASFLTQRWMEWAHAWQSTIKPALRAGRNPIGDIFGYGRSRGMAFWTDVRDWLGGWPMEFASIADTKNYCRALGLELLHIHAGAGNTEYLFRKAGAPSYWDGWLSRRQLATLAAPFGHQQGHCWLAGLPSALAATADTAEAPDRSRLMLYEDGVPVGFAHAPHADIATHGMGRYSHWHDKLLFSVTDNSDPNDNARTYAVCADGW